MSTSVSTLSLTIGSGLIIEFFLIFSSLNFFLQFIFDLGLSYDKLLERDDKLSVDENDSRLTVEVLASFKS